MTAKPYDLISRLESLVQLKRQPAIRENDEAQLIELAIQELNAREKAIGVLTAAMDRQSHPQINPPIENRC